jgi:hypothetical protein
MTKIQPVVPTWTRNKLTQKFSINGLLQGGSTNREKNTNIWAEFEKNAQKGRK